ncbi:hypothetical protein NJB93_20460 [Brucella intermedia]|uniref:hypothetical protein n=1 Tax=Brucella intermedia TaxID=94625 RepID=UPI00209AFBBE|nr:hypothetical protein [Brucella intermedia]MCO7728941.1 hypothetical protein [Brucella intermedia]
MTKIQADILAAAKAAAYATEADGNDEAAITSLVGVDVIAAAIHAERQRCADVAKSVWKEAQASEQFDTVKAVSRIRCRIDTGAAA